jgi:hypothetical protein
MVLRFCHHTFDAILTLNNTCGAVLPQNRPALCPAAGAVANAKQARQRRGLYHIFRSGVARFACYARPVYLQGGLLVNQYNLSDQQKTLIKFLVEQVRSGALSEEMLVSWSHSGSDIVDYDGSPPQFQKGALSVLESNGLINIRPQSAHTWWITLTGAAYEAVDSNFAEVDLSFLKFVTPLADVSGLDDSIKKRCLPILGTDGNDPVLWDSVVRTAGVILEERLRDVGGVSDKTCIGRDLVNSVFGRNGNLVAKFSNDSELQGYRELYAGVVGMFRNPSAHHLIDPAPEEGGAFIVFVNLLLKKLEALR